MVAVQRNAHQPRLTSIGTAFGLIVAHKIGPILPPERRRLHAHVGRRRIYVSVQGLQQKFGLLVQSRSLRISTLCTIPRLGTASQRHVALP